MPLFSLTSPELAALAAEHLPSGAGLAPRLYRAAFASGRLDLSGSGLSWASTHAWQALVDDRLPSIDRIAEDADGTAKAWLRLSDGKIVECVRIPMRYDAEGRPSAFTLCLSSQVGCRMGCTFCETGRMGLLRHLAPDEIVGQVLAVRRELGWQARNLVFMGMGEALDNHAGVIQAIRVLTDQRGLHYSFERLTVCTSGHAAGIAALAAMGWKRLNLSISLNGADDATRTSLMPVNRRTDLATLQGILAAYPQRANFTLGVNWCLLPGINDRQDDAERIAAWCRPLGRVLINVIPYNPGTAPIARAPTDDETDAFIAQLRAVGLPVRRRLTKGRSIMAACGQLGDPAARRRPNTSQPERTHAG